MSVEAYLNQSGEQGTVANEGGWVVLCEWVQDVPVEECPWLDHLCAHGYVTELEEFEAELQHLSQRSNKPDGVGEVLAALLKVVKARTKDDVQLDVTGGVEDKDEENDDE
jgi:hypothetical protein